MAINNTDYVSLRRLLEYHKEVVQPAIEDAGGGFKKPEIKTKENGEKYVIVSELATNTEYIIPAGVYIFHDQTAFDNQTTHDWNSTGNTGALSYAKILRTSNLISGYSLLAIGGVAQTGGRVAFKAWYVQGTPTTGFTSYTVTGDEYTKIANAILGVRIDNNQIDGTRNYSDLPNVESLTSTGLIQHGLLRKSDYDAFVVVKGAATSVAFEGAAPLISNNHLSIPYADNAGTDGVITSDDYDNFNSSMRSFALQDDTSAGIGLLSEPTFKDNKLTLTYVQPNTWNATLGSYNSDGVDGIISAQSYTKITEGLINAVSTSTSNEMPTISGAMVNGVVTRTLYIPMANVPGVTAGLLSNEYFNKFKAIADVLSDSDETDKALNTLNDIFDFLSNYDEETSLLIELGKKADLADTNTFTEANTFKNTVTVEASLYADGPFYVSDTFNVDSPIVFGNNSTYSFKNSNATKNLKLPFEVDGVGIAEFLTVVKYYNDYDILTSTGVLNECPKITATSFADWLASVA